MSTKYAYFAKAALAGVLVVPACGGSSKKKTAGEPDASADAAVIMDSGPDVTTTPDAGPDVTMTPDTGPDVVDAGMDVAMEAEAAFCAPVGGDTTAPTIVSATIESASAIRITFSEEVQPPDGIDPTKFRISLCFLDGGEGVYYSNYYDIGDYGAGSLNDHAFNDLSGMCTTEIVATPTTPLDLMDVCGSLSTIAGDFLNLQVGLCLHYTEAGSPTIQDRDGNALASSAPLFIEGGDAGANPAVLETSGQPTEVFEDNPIRIPIDCGDAGTFP